MDISQKFGWLHILIFMNSKECDKIYSSGHTHQDQCKGMVGQGNHLSQSLAALLVQDVWLLGSVQVRLAPRYSYVGTWDEASLS